MLFWSDNIFRRAVWEGGGMAVRSGGGLSKLFLVMLLGVTVFAWWMVSDPWNPLLNFFWSDTYAVLIQVTLVAAAVGWVMKRILGQGVPRRGLQWFYGILFFPVLLFPLLRCHYKVPYVFCRACPSPCPWGISRTFLFNGFLILNLLGRSWCSNLCPFGTFQELQSSIFRKHLRQPSWLSGVAYFILLATLGFYLAPLFRWPWLNWFDVGNYDFVKVTAIAALLIMLTAFLIPKFWCRNLCPVGTLHLLFMRLRIKKTGDKHFR